MNQTDFNNALIDFIKSSPTPFHAVRESSAMLEKAGFIRLNEKDSWNIKKSAGYFVTRNDSSLIAFTTGDTDFVTSGVNMAGSHTDSPCLKIKPEPSIIKKNHLNLGVEVYGGALLNTWFDRELSIAGKVSVTLKDDSIKHLLVDFKRPVAIIPSLAIHLDREANTNKSINAQNDLPPLILTDANGENGNFISILSAQLKKEHPDIELQSILHFELCFYDALPPQIVGLKNDFIVGGRLDNLLSCFVSLKSLIDTPKTTSSLIVLNDHEEVGSMSTTGAQGQFLHATLKRLLPAAEDFSRAISTSMMISIDNAHGLHPNFMQKYDENNAPLLNKGPAIKINANQRYASNGETIAIFKGICQKSNTPVQPFTMRSDMSCGSTIGPITSANIGVKTIDIGVPTFAMHSIRETAGIKDAYYLYQALKTYFAK